MNVRHGIAAAALLSVSILTVACGTTAGSATPLPVTNPASASNSVTTTTSPTHPSSSSVTARPTPSSSEQSPSSDDPTVTVVVEPDELDATTAIWLQNSCTDVDTLFTSLLAVPTVADDASVEEFRGAYVDYYASLADTLLGMTERLSALDAPTFRGGQTLHDGYLNYLVQLGDLTASGALAISDAPADAESIGAVIEQIQFETEQLSESDFGLSDFQGGQVQELMGQVPACQQLLNT